jgi:hypothetical protein
LTINNKILRSILSIKTEIGGQEYLQYNTLAILKIKGIQIK